MTQAGDLGDVTMSESLENFASILGGVMTAPWLKGGAACIAVGCEALGLPLDLVWCLVGLFIADFALGICIAVRDRQFSLKKFARGFASTSFRPCFRKLFRFLSGPAPTLRCTRR